MRQRERKIVTEGPGLLFFDDTHAYYVERTPSGKKKKGNFHIRGGGGEKEWFNGGSLFCLVFY